jgi:hypothetical protein
MRRLTASQVERTVEDVLGIGLELDVTDERLFTYASNTSSSVDAVSARGYHDFATAAAAAAELAGCDGGCLEWLLDDVGMRLFRRPLDDAQRARYTELFQLGSGNGGAREGAAWVLEAMLQSPSFLYEDEVVRADGVLEDHSLAARLALTLWGRNPAAELLEQAARGGLSTPEQLRDTATRMLDDPRAEDGIREFVDQWLDLARLDDVDQRPDLAELGAETLGALRDEPVQLFLSLLRGGSGIKALLTTNESFGSPVLDELYPAERAGILSVPGVVAALSHARRTSPTLRGKAVLTGFLCTPPPPPPAGVSVNLPDVGPDVSARERLELHMSDPACGSCHRGMDGIGFSLEKLDWLGRYREQENGHVIDDSSTFPLAGVEVTIQGPGGLGAALAAAPAVGVCLSRQWLRYALGVSESSATQCLVERMARELERGGIEPMMVTALASDWFRRGPEARP